jgi:deoxyribodipyrimidine photo-lyase
MKTLFLFGRDLRLQDNEALSYASKSASELLPAYLVPEEFPHLSLVRQHSLVESLSSLSASLPRGLEIAQGKVADALQEMLWFDPERVVATRSYDPAGMLFQAGLAQALFERGIRLELVGSNYAITPGTIAKDDGGALKVYGAFYKRWMNHGWAQPFELEVSAVSWAEPRHKTLPEATGPAPFRIKAGEAAALATWKRFKANRLATYDELRNRTDLGGTSHLSHALAHGEIHPRSLLVELGDSEAHDVYRREIAWREFYADVLYRNPHTYDDYYEARFSEMRYADPAEDAKLLEAWKSGNTGYPIVDAAMRQLNQTGWMHNRSRMIVASFLVKDLHFEWMVGARYFEEQLTDFDPASNSHGWQWTAGCGTDASPYFRVFNPVLQGQKFDPKGAYVRKYVPELGHIEGPKVHEPWELIDGYLHGYPERIVDHSKERDESLARLAEIRK